MYLKIFNNLSQQFNYNKRGEYIRHKDVEPCIYLWTVKYQFKIKKYLRNSDHKGKDHKGNHQLDDYVHNFFEVFHLVKYNGLSVTGI